MSIKSSALLLGSLCLLSLLLPGKGVSAASTVTGCAANSTDIAHLFATNTTITLERGTYCLSEYVFIAHTSGFLLTGTTGDSHDTIIQCSEGAGLAFLNITELTLSYVTILNCGVTGSNLTEFVRQVNGSVDMFYRVPDGSSAGVLIAASSNVDLLHVEIRESRGYGLFAINLYGQSNVTGAVFDSNHQPQPCSSYNISETIDGLGLYVGGGALIMFFDTKEGAPQPESAHLMIDDTVFTDNSACVSQDSTDVYYHISSSLQRAGYVIGGGGGLSIKVCQSSFMVKINVESNNFLNNRAASGGGANLVTFRHANISTITFEDCNFTNSVFDDEYQRTFGGGLAVITDLWYGDRNSEIINIIVNDCRFQSNSVQFGGAVAAFSPPFSGGESITTIRARITFNGCTFLENHATYGSAVYITNQLGTVMPTGILYIFNSCTFRNNSQGTAQEAATSSVGSGAFHVSSIVMVLSNSLIEGTTGSGLWTESAYTKIEGTVNITGNSALYGGGITFLGYGFVIMGNNSRLVIENNVAARVGGGIYYTTAGRISETGSTYDCFLLFEPGDPWCTECMFQGQNISVKIMHNHAALGSVIYGSLLDSCWWAYNLSSPYGPGGQNNKSHTIHTLYEEYGQYFEFSPDLNTSTAVNTDPVNPHVDSRGMSNVEVMPGQYFHVAGNALDRLDQPVSDFIVLWVLNTEFNHSVPTFSAQVGEQGLWLMTNNSMTVARVSGPQDSSTTVAFTSLQSAGISLMNVSLTECSNGFFYVEGHCQCEPKFKDFSELVSCSDMYGNISVKDTVWFGNLNGNKQLGDNADNYVADFCYSLNCNSTHVQGQGSQWLVVNTSDLDAQCPGNRSGLFCGGCSEGFSVVLGTSRCRECRGYAYISLIIVFAILGILLLAAIAFLQVNVSDGWINGVILYANIYTIFSGALIPRRVVFPANFNVYFLFNWLSLQWGIESCFYEGMTPLAHNGLELVFPIYLVLLVVATVVISRFSANIKWHNLFGNPLKVIATLLLLTFSAFMGICMRILGFMFVHTFSGETQIRWLFDGNISYFFSPSRIILVLLSIVIICVQVAFVLFLLIPCHCGKYRLSCCARTQRRALPFIDAFQAPFKDTLYISRSWEGWRFFFRIILHIVANYVFSQESRLWLLLFALILFHSAQSLLSPHKFWGRNVLDSFFTLNMSLLVILLLASDNFDVTNEVFLAFYHILLSCACLVSISVLLYSCYPVLKTVFVKLHKRICRKGKSVNIASVNSTAYVDPDLLEVSNQEEMTYGNVSVDPAHALDRESFVFERSDSEELRNLTN